MTKTISPNDSQQPGEVPGIKDITLDSPWEWIAAGWKDYRETPIVSLSYGLTFVFVSYLLTLLIYSGNMFYLVPPLTAGYFLVAPILAVGLYEMSRRLETGEETNISVAIQALNRNPTNLLAMGLVLMMSLLFWMMIANLVFALFYTGIDLTMDSFLVNLFLSGENTGFLAAGMISGGIVAVLVFSISVISVPMLVDRPVNVFMAVRTSFNAMVQNPRELFLWGALIVMFVWIGLMTFYIAFAVFMPIIGHASWHAYRDLVPTPGEV
ncbi:MAG: DUF2189 domain-containing protein [Gammaproteobacteria bacterium]|nr:DUF2189 domain-containing protein [Gammaproteobacteria bacterium]